MKRVQSTCNYCALDCNMDFYVEDGKIVKVLPTRGYPVNDGFCCIKGLSLDKQQTVIKTSPLPKIRQADGTMKEVSWEEGFSHVADKLLRDGRVRLKDCKSAKGKTYNATVLLSCEADGRSKFSLEFEGGC